MILSQSKQYQQDKYKCLCLYSGERYHQFVHKKYFSKRLQIKNRFFSIFSSLDWEKEVLPFFIVTLQNQGWILVVIWL